jgi:rubredoxin
VLEIKFKPFPYYEGFNKLNINQYWLGLYWRNNNYDIDFLKAMAELCIRCRIGKINITPWKSLIIKPIKDDDRLEWEKFLGIRGINVRHSLLEMNWHIPVDDEKALMLKSYIVNCLNQLDISTYGLSFGINYSDDVFFTSIVIITHENQITGETVNFEDTYSVIHATNFDPNTLNYITYAQDVVKADLPQLLIELSKMYFTQLGSHDKVVKSKSYNKLVVHKTSHHVLQCPDCMTVIDSQLGSAQLELAPGDSIEALNNQSMCPVCDTSIILFKKVSDPEFLNSL